MVLHCTDDRHSLTDSSKLEIGNFACLTVLAPPLSYSIRVGIFVWSGHPGLSGHHDLSGYHDLSGHPGGSGHPSLSGHPVCLVTPVSLVTPVHVVTLVKVWSQFA